MNWLACIFCCIYQWNVFYTCVLNISVITVKWFYICSNDFIVLFVSFIIFIIDLFLWIFETLFTFCDTFCIQWLCWPVFLDTLEYEVNYSYNYSSTWFWITWPYLWCLWVLTCSDLCMLLSIHLFLTVWLLGTAELDWHCYAGESTSKQLGWILYCAAQSWW
jgi:hypothetical protein